MLGIGISSGGSFTDAVIMDLKDWSVLAKAKSPTTYRDFSEGIINSLDKVAQSMSIKPEDVGLVSVATTLATNAIIEGKGGRVALLLLGIPTSDITSMKPSPARDLPINSIASFQGGHDPHGIELQPLDLQGIEAFVKQAKDSVDSFAVSGIFSVRNPEHEMLVKKTIGRMTGKPVVCGYELAGALGIYERTVTAVLNARIIPIIERLLISVKEALKNRGITAPLMLIRGDGALMNELVAKERPIETIQSGPAASVIGGKFLSGKDDVVIMDIGSTTTIISTVKSGSPRIDESGATISGWKTRVKAVDADALGNGGDSWIWMDEAGRIRVGPRRVMPLAFATQEFPLLKEKLMRGNMEFINASKAMRKPDGSDLMKRFVETITRMEPVTLEELQAELKDVPIVELVLGMMEDSNYVSRIGLTPTDLMHVTGMFTAGDIDSSRIGTEIFAKRLGTTADELVGKIWGMMVHKIALRVAEIQAGLAINREEAPDTDAALGLLNGVVGGKLGELDVSCTLSLPIVGIGAPAQFFIPYVGKKLNTKAIVPLNHEVGAAIGALVGNVVNTFDLVIQREITPEGYVVFPGRHVFTELESAMEFAVKMGKEEAMKQAIKTGAKDIEFKIQRNDKVFAKVGFMWSEVKVSAAGRPSLKAEVT